MITFRHFITSIVAVFLALAVGIVLGGGPLSSNDDDEPAPTSASRATGAEAETRGAYADAFVASVAPTLTAGRLADRTVALVTLPGADEQSVTALSDQIGSAGGAVSGRYAVSDAMVSPSEKTLVDTLGSQLMTQQGKKVAPDASTYERMGHLLGLAVATKADEGDSPGGKESSILQSLVGADLVAAGDDVTERAPLVLVVLGGEPDPDGGDAIVAGLVDGLSQAATGVVVAGTVADGQDGQVTRLRAESVSADVATVDGVDTAAGRTATVLALARSLTTRGGAFGATGADGPAPLG